ncbi:dihydrolipoyl dehydrogenase [Janthinobacterium sp. 17J80-10]|uniref:dihydrolipoyl dehydrogenase n=1 Tax=Janthinobacterium sp. 17J80-10 TaxID=2497863 RepID=UPI0010056D3B|nr:dihydrolipoyl dehydrogenase [Janthinobacterium sp. 17J80-10]QAU32805.1 dihydrolipoyl dehydrogenase [Janthinobacterium sp. 17J80-10]
MTQAQYDLVVVGGGPGGYVAAIRAAQLGLKTALVEKAQLGGICLNWGCIPTKALLRSADVLRMVRDARRFGVNVGTPEIDLKTMVERSRAVSAQLQGGVGYLMKKNKVTVVNGHARLAGRGKLEVTGTDGKSTLSARNIILATGARARVLPGLVPDGESVWSYREALVPSRVPKRLVVIGAGAIGIEFASFYHALGAEVSVVEMAERVLPVEDEEVSAYVADTLRKEGMKLYLGASIKTSSKRGAGQAAEWTLALDGKHKESLTADVVLTAAGIVGNVEDLGLEGTAVKVDRTHIVTDAYGATGEQGVYAIGDVAGAPWLAHKASHEAIICIEKIAGKNPHPLDISKIPACTYSHPQVASVGMTEAKAKAAGHRVKVGKFPFAVNGKALALGSTGGFTKVVFDEATGELLGAHMVGEEVTEMIQGYTIARELETTEAELMETIFPHPTQSEAMHEAVLAAYERALHI